MGNWEKLAFLDVPEDFPHDIFLFYEAKYTAIDTVRMGADDAHFPLRGNLLDALDQQSISRLVERNDITGRGWDE